jgi:hypothetical protein
MVKRINYGFGFINLSQYRFDASYFYNFAIMFHPNFKYCNPLVFDLQLKEVYYIHLIDSLGNIISVVPLELKSNLDCYYKGVDITFCKLSK